MKLDNPIQEATAPTKGLFLLIWALLCMVISWIAGQLPPLIGGTLVVIVAAILFSLWWRQRAHASSVRTRALGGITQKEPRPAKGLLFLVSPYSPGRNAKLTKADIDDRLARAADPLHAPLADDAFAALVVPESNVWPIVQAVRWHSGKAELREVWLIATKADEKSAGSTGTAAFVAQYIGKTYGIAIRVHHGAEFSVEPWNYPALFQLVDRIFRESGYTEAALLADITGGFKIMSVAMALACVAPQRMMQYMASDRDWQGQPIPEGELKPVAIDTDPVLLMQ